jgi:CheY-like chemotaxis protein
MRQCQSTAAEISPTIPMGGSPSLAGAPAIESGHLGLSQPWMGRRLLWVDDSRLLLSLYKSVFEKLGFEVLATSSPAEALQYLSSGVADLAILDYDMPEMDGGMLASLMKDRYPLFPIILYSGNASIPSGAHHWVDAICAKGAREDLLNAIERLAIKASTAHALEPLPVFTPSSNH